MYSADYDSPIGKIIMVSDGEALISVSFYGQEHFLSSINDDIIQDDDLTIFKKVKRWLDSYFNGENPEIDFTLKPQGSEFRCKVWARLLEIPYGKTVT